MRRPEQGTSDSYVGNRRYVIAVAILIVLAVLLSLVGADPGDGGAAAAHIR